MIEIRLAQPEDSTAIAKICTEELGYPCSAEFVENKLRSLDLSREKVYAAFDGDMAVGFIHAERYDTLYSDTLVNILGLAVCKAYQRQGIGRQLMLAAEEYAAQLGACGIRLSSGGSRHDAHEFYRSIGFDSEKIQVRFIKTI